MKQGAKDRGRIVTFELQAKPGSAVAVAGTFNGWDPKANPMKDNPDSGHYVATVRLPAGRHEYKFVVDGAWSTDPKCAETAPDGFGAVNSVVRA